MTTTPTKAEALEALDRLEYFIRPEIGSPNADKIQTIRAALSAGEVGLAKPAMPSRDAIAAAIRPDLYSDNPRVAHMAASPLTIEAARRPILAQADAVLAYFTTTPPQGDA